MPRFPFITSGLTVTEEGDESWIVVKQIKSNQPPYSWPIVMMTSKPTINWFFHSSDNVFAILCQVFDLIFFLALERASLTWYNTSTFYFFSLSLSHSPSDCYHKKRKNGRRFFRSNVFLPVWWREFRNEIWKFIPRDCCFEMRVDDETAENEPTNQSQPVQQQR